MKKILVIDDDMDICSLLKRYLGKNGYQTEVAYSGSTGLKLVEKTNFDVVLCDFRLPDQDGLQMTQSIKKVSPNTQVIVITGYSDVKMAVNLIKRGAFEYVTKPIHPEEILHTISEALKSHNTIGDTISTSSKNKKTTKKTVKTKLPGSSPDSYVKGKSDSSKQIQKLIALVAPTDMTVVILGESGTGKEVTAKSLHYLSNRKNKKFIAVDCGAIPKEIAGSELFGHKKGSFTGAFSDKVGHFEAANGGTLFLDEIGNLTYDNQIKLLRVLQERKVKRIGDTEEKDVDVRIIVATNENLKTMVSKGEFREDLYYRLNEFKIELTALRERKSEIKDYAEFMLKNAAEDLNKEVTKFSDDVLNVFKEYLWPGNLREMKNVVKRSTLMTTGDVVELDQIPEEIKSPDFYQELSSTYSEEENYTDLKQIAEAAEKKAILSVLGKTGFNKSKTAKILKVDRKTLYNKIAAYNISLPE